MVVIKCTKEFMIDFFSPWNHNLKLVSGLPNDIVNLDSIEYENGILTYYFDDGKTETTNIVLDFEPA